MKFHDELNPKLWEDNKLKPEVADKLREIANAFIEYMDINEDAVEDVVITGSSASYNYTPHSDLDLHLKIDYDKIHEDCPIVEGFLWALKATFNKDHDISIYGVPVEVYAESLDQDTVHNGLYSIWLDKWIDLPKKIPPTDNDAAVQSKYEEIKEAADRIEDSEVAEELINKIYEMRKAGLNEVGEFSTENLAFKKLRDNGILDKLKQMKKEKIDKQLSLESYNEALQVGEAEILEWLKQRQVKVGYGFNKLSKEGTAYYMAKLINSLDENIINKIKEAHFSNFNTKEFTLENKEALEAPKVVPCNSIITHLVCLYINPETNKTYNEKPTEEETLHRSIKIKMNKLYNKKTGWDRKGYYFLQKNGNKYEIVTNLGKGQHEVVTTADSLQELNDILTEKLNIGQNNSKNESMKEDYPKNREELINKYKGVFRKNGITLEISNLYNKKEDNFSGGFGKSYNVEGKVFNKFEKAIEYMKKLSNKNESIKEELSTAKVTFDNGDIITTDINGTEKEIRDYYAIGKTFNLGQGEYDKLAKVVDVEILDESIKIGDKVQLKRKNNKKGIVKSIFNGDKDKNDKDIKYLDVEFEDGTKEGRPASDFKKVNESIKESEEQKLNLEDFKIEKTDSGVYKVAYDSRIGYIKPDKSYSKVQKALGNAIYKYNTKDTQADRKALINKLHKLFREAGIPKMEDMKSSIRGYRPITKNGYYIDIYSGDRTSFNIGLSNSNDEYFNKIKEILNKEGIEYWQGLDYFSIDMEKNMKNESLNEEINNQNKELVNFIVIGAVPYLRGKLRDANLLYSTEVYTGAKRENDGLLVKVPEDEAAEFEMWLQDQNLKYYDFEQLEENIALARLKKVSESLDKFLA